jgi:HSP20 family molecular chaperone IbpA
MFNMIPWKKKSNGGKVSVWRDQPEYYPLSQFRNEFESLFDRFWNDWGALTRWEDDWRPSFRDELEDNANDYVFHVELPGFDQDEIEVNARYRNGVLEIRLPKTEQSRGKRIPVSAA